MSYTSFTSTASLDATFSGTEVFPITLVCWIKVPAATWDSTSGKYILHFNDETFGTGDLADSIWTQITGGTADQVRAQAQGPSAGNQSNEIKSSTLYENKWVPLIGRFGDTTDSAQITIGSTTYQGSKLNSDRSITEAFKYLRVGANTYNNFIEASGGVLIAEVAIFDKLLSDAEVNALESSEESESGPPPYSVASSNCIAYWSLNSDQSSHADESPNSTGPSLAERGTVAYNSDHPNISGVAPIARNHLSQLMSN